MTSSAFLVSALWFVVILAMIPAALWLLKRSPAGARLTGTAAGGGLRQVSMLPISASQRIVTIEVGEGEGRRWLVLGVTPQQIATLHTLAPPAADPATLPARPPPAAGFAQMLARLRGDRQAPP